MSSFNILGFFQVKAGHRVIVNKPNSSYATHYVHYNTHYHPPAHGRHGHFCSVLCTIDCRSTCYQFITTNTLTLDVMTFFVLPGSPDSDTYNVSVVMVSRVTGSPQTLDEGHGSRAVTGAVSDFVCGETKASTVQLIFDFSTACWTRAPVPQPNTAIQFYGVCRELSPTGILRLKVDATALNISSNALAPPADTSGSAGSTASAPVMPSKRRKFDTMSPPPSVDSLDSPFASATSTPSANITTSMVSVPDPNARIGPMHHSQLFQQYPQYMPPPTGYSAFQSPYAPYNSLGEYTLPPSVDSRASTSTLDSDSTDISSASVASPLTVPVQDNSAFNWSAANPHSFPMTQIPPATNSSTASTSQSNTPTSVQPFVFLGTGPRRS
ncbi:hypothetical protein B0H13DRAFT_2665833 [Mycena leptocephala]|nr:hypothetical protein B0H13DRAFT_2665833 [Mycena leptocephala]